MTKSKPPTYYLVSRDGAYHVYRNDKPEGVPIGISSSSYEDGMKKIAELESSTFETSCGNKIPVSDFKIEMIPDEIDAELTKGATVEEEPSKFHVRKHSVSNASSRQNTTRSRSSHLRQCSAEDSEKAIRLFRFLRELTLLRSKIVRNLDKYSVLWMSEVPKEKGCSSALRISIEDRSDVLLSIEMPKQTPPPPVSALLKPWIDFDVLSDPNSTPILRKKIFVQREDKPEAEESELETKRIEDFPSLCDDFFTYLDREWRPWSVVRKAENSVMETYEFLYDVFQTLQKVAENWELLFCVGVLNWKTPSQQVACRHILTARVNIAFDTVHGVMVVSAPPEGLKFQLEQDMLELSERPANHHRAKLTELLESLNENPLDVSLAEKFLQSWLNALSPRGRYSSSDSPGWDALEDPTLSYCPAIVFRQRTERSLVRLIEEIINNVEDSGMLPFGIERLVSIVDDSSAELDVDDRISKDGEIYFPLEANPDQREIAEKLRTRHGVLVQGPPGTGKSHTIANLVCHLLATGKRILVTSHTPRALTVLRDKFPEEMRALCVSVIGDDNTETRKALEESVSGITNKKNVFNKAVNIRRISELEKDLDEYRQAEAWTINSLRSIRESDTYKHPIKFSKYQGTIQSIAREVKLNAAQFCWLNETPEEGTEPPLLNDEAKELLELCRTLSEEYVQELQKYMPDVSALPDPEKFSKLVETLKLLRVRSEKLSVLKEHCSFAASSKLAKDVRDDLVALIGTYIDTYTQLQNRREPWAMKAANEIASDRDRSWRKLFSLTNEKLALLSVNEDSVKSLPVTGMGGRDHETVRLHALALRDHLERKGSLGFGPFRPKVVKDALYLIRETRIGDESADNPRALSNLIRYIDHIAIFRGLRELWNGVSDYSCINDQLLVAEIEDACEPLEMALSLHEQIVFLRNKLKQTPGLAEPAWDKVDDLLCFKDVLESGHVEERLNSLEDEIHTLMMSVNASCAHPNAHPSLMELRNALEEHNAENYHKIQKNLLSLSRGRQALQRKVELLQKLKDAAPALAIELSESFDEEKWDSQISDFEGAWNWARTKRWIQTISDPSAQRKLTFQLEESQKNIRRTLGLLAAEKAWQHTFDRLSDVEHSHLIAWQMAVKRVGKGTGKHAEKHRKAARKHMEECKSAIPAWIMPIHKVVETTQLGGEPFDVVIVDEASQSGPEALFLMYIAKQIVVVGDDKQISPDFVGQNREEVDLLREQYLKNIPFDDALGVDHSFFDQAKIRYRGTIRLKEHFRCMPEIIQFSNKLCYTDDPLIPLRQFGAGRLNPVVRTTYVQNGYYDADARKGANTAEADSIIEQIRLCCEDPAYEGKSIGVISLLNTSGQAEYIERQIRLKNIMSKEELDARKFRVGDSYVFQGDERDIIFLSMVIAPHREGKKLYPLASDKDHRRFNVAASRARDQVWLFHSVSLSDLNPKCVRYQLLDYYTNPNVETVQVGDTDIETLKKELTAAQSSASVPPKPFDSWFEVEVFLRLVSRGYRVIPQYSMNGYSIDLLVEGMKGRLAVECDGDYWHGISQYEHDMRRQRDLERCGMHFWRVRGSSFYLDPDAALEDLWMTLDKMKIFPNVESESEFTEIAE